MNSFLSGFLIGLTTLFRHDLGFYSCFITFFFIFFNEYFKSDSNKFIKGIKSTGLFLIGAFVIIVPVTIYLLLRVPLSQLFDQLIKTQVAIFPKYRALPNPISRLFLPQYSLKFSYFISSWFGNFRLLSLILRFISTCFLFYKIQKRTFCIFKRVVYQNLCIFFGYKYASSYFFTFRHRASDSCYDCFITFLLHHIWKVKFKKSKIYSFYFNYINIINFINYKLQIILL